MSSNPSISVIIPWRESNQRDRNIIAEWCFKRYKFLLPEAEFMYSDSGDKIFSRGKSINKGVEECSGDYIIITDADYLFSEKMVKEIINKQPWTVAVKNNNYFYLDSAITNLVLNSCFEVDINTLKLTSGIQSCPFFVYGGLMAMPKNNFIKFDPALKGYGYEDNCWYYTMNAYFGKEHRTNQKMYHMFHFRIENSEYMKRSYENKAYHDQIWLPIKNDRKKIKEFIKQKGLYLYGCS